jgi:thiol-disulfide isomerase/thioredoxin
MCNLKNIRITIYFLITILYLSSNSSAQSFNIDSIISLTQNKLLNSEQLNYTCNYSALNIGAVDTDRFIIKTKIKKVNTNDKIEYIKTTSAYYDKKPEREILGYYDIDFGFYYTIENDKKEATFTKTNPKKSGALGYFHSGLKYFIDSNFSKEFTSNITLHEYLGIDTFNNLNCYLIDNKVADNIIDNLHNFRTKYYINVKDLMIVRIIKSFDIGNESAFFDFKITDYHFNKDSIKDFYQSPNLNDYTIKYDTVDAPPIKPYKLLNKPINDMVARDIRTLKSEKIIFKNKITLIDFWYMGCYGCMLSYPVIDSLHLHFENNKNVQIIGMNGSDIDPQLVFRKQKYLKDFKITTNNYAIKKEELKFFTEDAMPFFIIIDKKGIIRYYDVGYNINLFEELKTKIENLTQQ